MTPVEAAAATGVPIGRIGSKFMFDAATYAAAEPLGFTGLDFYYAGRCGVLGDTSGDVAAAALGFFGTATVQSMWDQGRAIAGAEVAARAFGEACDAWGRTHFTADVDYGRFAELAGRVVTQASASGLPLFAGWRLLPVPSDAPAAAAHHINGLRELRGGLHLVAVLAEGVDPLDAVLANGGESNAELLGHTGPFADPNLGTEVMETIEARTDELMGRQLAALDETERVEFCDLVSAIKVGLRSR